MVKCDALQLFISLSLLYAFGKTNECTGIISLVSALLPNGCISSVLFPCLPIKLSLHLLMNGEFLSSFTSCPGSGDRLCVDWWRKDGWCSTDMYVCLFSDLDRDFWNNNDSSSVQQRWSSYPPKEFVLNISPYAPYGDPRLTLKWVSVQAGKRHKPLTHTPTPTLTTHTPDLSNLQHRVWLLHSKRPSDSHKKWPQKCK